ncbi:MAG: glucosaminidase domain-containing protein [Bacteroidales bacterium]|nr:glucosaminidase domain-containing protein [Lentimicrobiaceae bacterium]MDD5695355.1 glucosaminidase domain-containing protein [Bacteroidales bacterium]
MKKVLCLLIVMNLLPAALFPQSLQRMTAEEYIRKYRVVAIHEMNLHRIPASITIAQGLLETDNGNSELARLANNHFGIKCKSEWTGQTYYKDDDQENECFRQYDSPYQSYADHSVFLSTHERYRCLFDLELKDYKGWAKGLKTAGYATNPEYGNRLIKLIEEYALYQLDDQYEAGKILIINDIDIYSDALFALQLVLADSIESRSFPSTYRKIYINNDVRFVFALRNDSYYTIASDFGIYSYQIHRYNELPKRGSLMNGQIIYIERKKKRSIYDYHIVKEEQTLHFIAQQYAVLSKSLLKMNLMKKNDPLRTGQILRLNPGVPLP